MRLMGQSPLIIVALLTPFRSDGAIDEAGLAEHLAFLTEEGIDGVMLSGTTGEGPLLDDDEVATLTRCAREASKGGFRVLTHVGRPGTSQTVRLAEMAIANGADILSAVTPYYYSLEDSQLLRHYRTVLRTTGRVPFLAYSIPDRTRNDLSPEMARVLAEDGLAGIKDSTKSFERHLEYLAIRDEVRGAAGFAVYMGSDSMVLGSFEHGSSGCVSAIANVRPDLFVRLRAALASDGTEEAKSIQGEILRMRSRLAGPTSISSLKTWVAEVVAARGGHYSATVREPLA